MVLFSKSYYGVRLQAWNQTVPQHQVQEFMDNLSYQRDHPLFDEWPEWKEVVSKYYSHDATMFVSTLCNRSATMYPSCFWDQKWHQLASLIELNIDFWRNKSVRTSFYEVIYHGRPYFLHDAVPSPGKAVCECTSHLFWDEVPESARFPYTDCEFQRDHILDLYCSVICFLMKNARRCVRKYYRRLLRVLYALSLRRLLNFDYEMIFNPKEYNTTRNLLRKCYHDCTMDSFTGKEFRNLPYKFESLKHKIDWSKFATQQSGASQSISATMFDEIAELASQFPVQQGYLDFNHCVSVNPEQFARFEKTVVDTQERFISAIQETIKNSAKEIMVMFVFVATVAMLGYTVIKYGLKNIINALNLLYKVVCGNILTDDNAIVEQAGGISLPFLPALLLNNVIAPPQQVLTKLWNDPQTDKIMRRIGYLGDPKIAKGVDKISVWIKEIINNLIKWYKEEILGLSVAEDIDSHCSPIEVWYEESDNFVRSYYDGTMQWNDMTWSVLMGIYSRGIALTRNKAFAEFKDSIWKVVFKLGNILEKFNTRGRSSATVRNPPVTIYLTGGTGVGKSSVTYPLAAEILQGIFQREPASFDLAKYWKNLIYMRSPEQEFWDGYENQLVTVFDDFSQLVDSSSSPNLELFEIIRAANSFPYPLHMASIDQKATTTFNSKIIMVSSNLEQPQSASLNFPTALQRRFDLCIRVKRKPGVIVKPDTFDPSIYEFQTYDMVTGAPGDYITYKDIIFRAVSEYFRRKGFVDSMDSYITKKLSERPVEQSLGTFAGNVVCGLRSAARYTVHKTIQNYNEFKGVMVGDAHYAKMAEVRIAMEEMRLKMVSVKDHWDHFKTNHAYLHKAMKFTGIMILILGVLKLYNSFVTSNKKEKIMSEKEFCRAESYNPQLIKAKVEGYNQPTIKAKVESYNAPQIKCARVESKMPGFKVKCHHEYALEDTKENVIIDNTHCFICSESNVNANRLYGVLPEGYTQAQIKSARMESVGIQFCCQHEFQARFEANPCGVYFLSPKSERCSQCNVAVAEGVKDLNASEILMKVIRSNYYKIYTLDSHEAIGHAMFLRGQIVMCPKHYITAFKKVAGMGGSNRVYFRNVFLDRAFEVDVNDILANAFYLDSPEEGNGLVTSRDIMAFPLKTATFHGNIIPYFADRESLSYVKSSDVVMPVILNNNIAGSDRAVVGFRFTKGHSALAVRDSIIIEDNEGQPARVMRTLWEYSLDTQATECGAPIIVRNVNIAPGKIVGMHVAGQEKEGLGYATPIYKHDVEKIVSKFNAWDSVEFRLKTKLAEYPLQQCQVPANSEFIRLGSVARPVAQPSKSKIIPSPLFNKIKDVTTRPCALRPTNVDGKSFDPRGYRLGRLGNIPQYIKQLNIEIARDALVDEISERLARFDFGNNVKSRYTFEEAVQGIDGEEFINAIKRGTSPGYPFVHMKGFENRKVIFGDDEKCDMSRVSVQILKSRCEQMEKELAEGIVSEHIFMDTLKDERKALHKYHKTRLFSAGPLDYLIVCKQYFNGIVHCLQRARNFCGISVGTNVYSQDWNDIVRVLLSKSNKVVAGDFEGFDASQSMQLLMGAGRVLIELSKRFCGTTDEEAFIMWGLLISLFNSVHITGNEVYMWTHSLPSGHYLTAIINSIFVLLVFCLCWMNNKEASNYMVARSFFKKCGIVAYGDDHVVTIPSDELETFNQETIPVLMAQLGLSYTMEDKDAVVQAKARTIEEVAYLKRKFTFDVDRHRWVGPLDLNTVLESPMWLHRCPDPIEQVKAQMDNSLRELSIHDKDSWNKWSKVFADLGRKLGHYTEFVNQEETRALVLD